MLKSVLLVCFFILVLNEASVQETVQVFIGDSVVLPCRSPRQPTKFTAYWRYEDSKNVYDIQDGVASTKEQEPVYKSRTESFPAEYSQGNFSLKLRKLQNIDAGSFCCFLPEFNSVQICTVLQVKEKSRGIQEKPGFNRGIESKAERLVSLLNPLFAGTILLWLCVVIMGS
ncbi:CD276 antigen isoform X2 [Pimephales promelas]|uniref:CD276 antigen isoform X2 n=1 Tax=Pimephales promelas TaxID=90988 RepID=UPI0019559C57|nr:CD276 antigen isoform X2 [Pimephales promelas]KAG1939889.1 HERV-H LTR-associating protein [Pimephales promelas]